MVHEANRFKLSARVYIEVLDKLVREFCVTFI